MSPAEPPPRYPTEAAQTSLAKRLDLFVDDSNQDWEWTVADHARIDSFVDLYTSGDLSDDERFSLMEIIIQSSEEHPAELAAQPRWGEIDTLLRSNSLLHAASIYYWSLFDTEPGDDSAWRVTPTMRSIVRDTSEIFPTR